MNSSNNVNISKAKRIKAIYKHLQLLEHIQNKTIS